MAKTRLFPGLLLALSAMLASGLAQSAALTRTELAAKLRAYGAFSSLEVKFRQTKNLREMGVKIDSEGVLELARPSRIRWEIIKPSSVVVKLDEQEIRIEVGKGKDRQVQVLQRRGSPSDPMDRSLSELVSWLNMDVDALDRQYSVYPDGEAAFRFEPKQKDVSVFKSLRMELAEQGYLRRLRIEELSGDSMEIEFGKPRVFGMPPVSSGRRGAAR